eukprot:CAMPEP_0195567462 /NCGR_PEP_ID=MMETSP0814-20130614/1662_1 /TAXON_ID=97485 /ORGANISM="Prymnesium parvum, Strain Texoma1" /LENGTH=287 /DNA_ID=CAMNT_0040702663 /DNA_START=265 /DNA_END=1126 /DNA_ORIENTATION=+
MDIAEASTARGINTLHPGPQPLASKLFLALRFQGGADAAALRAHLEHKLPVGLTLLVDRPPAARLVVIGAHRRAQPARLGALARHEVRIRDALPVVRPLLALRRVRHVGAHALRVLLAHVARRGARLEHEARVRLALPRRRPAGAVFLPVLALGGAHAAAHGALPRGELRVLHALAEVRPAGALGHAVDALGRADAARRGARAQHEGGVRLALAREAHEAQVALRSAQVWLHTPQASGQMRDMYSGFVAQCSSFAQKPHSAFLSLQIPARSSGASAANMAAAELTKY